MLKKRRIAVSLGLALFVLGLSVGNLVPLADVAEAQPANRVFELRTYTAFPGRLDALHARFAQHSIGLLEKHGMTNIGYFSPRDPSLADNTLVYLLAHGSREAADESWAAFVADPEWKRVDEESQRDGEIVEKIERIYLDATDYSPMK